MTTVYYKNYTSYSNYESLLASKANIDWDMYHTAYSLGIAFETYKNLCAAEPDPTKRTKEFYPEYFI